MSILHLDSGRAMRGGQWQVLRLMEGLAAEGVESTLLARPDGPLFDTACERRLRAEPLAFVRVLLMARKYSLVHAHDAHCHTLAVMAGAGPLVVSRRVAFEIRSGWKYRRAAHYLAVSNFVADVLERGGAPRTKITVVPDGVPVLDPSHGNHVVAPATSDARKGTELALEAARLAGVELKLSLELERDLKSAGIFVYLTHSEGLGSGVLLAMSAGVPVVASRVGGLVEIVDHGRTGLLVENEPQAVAEAIGELRSNPELAARMGAAGRRRVVKDFTVEHMVRRTMEVYRKVLA